MSGDMDWMRDLPEMPERRMLAGEFECKITTEEGNEWFAFATQTEEFRRLSLAKLDLDRCSRGTLGISPDQAIEYHNATMRDMHAVSKRWYADLVEQRAAKRAAVKAEREKVPTGG